MNARETHWIAGTAVTAALVVGAALVAASIGASTPGAQGGDVEIGRRLFDRSFHRVEGLGAPEMNADSCRGCHQDPVLGGAGGLELNVSRMAYDNNGADPPQNVDGGQTLSRLFPPFIVGREEWDPLASDVFEQRQTPTLLGGGLIDGIPDGVIAANEDPLDSDGDGIFGVARRVQVAGFEEIGRFGWKAQLPRLRDILHDACFNELGLTTPDEGRGFSVRSDADQVADPELSIAAIDHFTAFLEDLPAPQRGGSSDPRVAIGESLFATIGCAKCHVPALQGADGPVPLFSNLLLHDVMPDGFRGMAEEGAGVGMYRTPPLWGIGDTAPYMHDGRAEDLRAAILAHFGEAEGVRTSYEQLAAADQEALSLFLEDL